MPRIEGDEEKSTILVDRLRKREYRVMAENHN